MKHFRIIAMVLGLSLSGGAAFADDGHERRQDRDDDSSRMDGDLQGRWDNHLQGRWDNHMQGRWDNAQTDRRGADRWNGGRGDGRWGRLVPVRFVNARNQFVTLYLNGRYLGRLAPNSRERIELPVGAHVVTYRVGFRRNVHQLRISAFRGEPNRVVIAGWQGRGWGAAFGW